MRTSCCLNLPPPTSNQAPIVSFIPTKPHQVSLVKTEGNWKRQCVIVGVASYCAIIGLELSNSSSWFSHEAIAKEIMIKTSEESNHELPLSSIANGGGSKWSEKRACPAWRGSSLETIVPENLPRPAARRRYEAIGSTSKVAPPLSEEKVILLRSNKESCFSM